MRDFSFHTPESLEEALALLDRYGENARPIAGGTALVVLMKQSLVYADHLVSLRTVRDLREISLEGGDLHIGALVTHRQVETSLLVKEQVPFLAEIYNRVATVRVRNVATVGGGLAHADPAQDPPPGLMVLGASVRLKSIRGERTVPVEELFSDYFETAIQPDEVLVELVVPPLPQGARTVYLKYLPRTADDYPTVGVAAMARQEHGRCEDLRVALGALGTTPLRATAVEDLLRGTKVTQEAVRDAAEAVRERVEPLDDFRGSADYKREMAVVFTRRALEQAFGLAR